MRGIADDQRMKRLSVRVGSHSETRPVSIFHAQDDPFLFPLRAQLEGLMTTWGRMRSRCTSSCRLGVSPYVSEKKAALKAEMSGVFDFSHWR